MIKIFLEK